MVTTRVKDYVWQVHARVMSSVTHRIAVQLLKRLAL